MKKTSQRFHFLIHNKYSILLPGIALVVGGVIYIFLRPAKAIFYNWIDSIGINLPHHPIEGVGEKLPEFVTYSLPNGLWAFAYALIIARIWWINSSNLKYFWLASIPLLILGFEILQYTNTLNGTFCLQDLTSGIIGILAGTLTGIKLTKHYNYEKVNK